MGGLSSLFKLSVIMSMVDRMTPEAMRAGRSANELQGNIGRLRQSSGDFLKFAGKWAAAAVAAVAVAIGAMGGAAIAMANEIDQATGKLQAQTGITRQVAEDLMQVSKGVYASGRGESIEQITADLAKVRQNLGGLSKEATQAFLSSSYAVEQVSNGATGIEEITKVTKTLMQNFKGLSETDALDMITVGFQRGGDFAGDFMDTINEYSVHFAGLGMSAEQMFATLLAGSKEGAFNLDKVGDAVKESFIRMQDLSQGSMDAFRGLGLDANKMSADIAAGGDRANQAFQATLLSLGAMKDPLKQNAIGVALFGTQWEDVKQNVVLAMAEGQKGLGDFQGATEAAGDALYNNLTNKFTRLRRSITVELASAAGPLTGLLNQLMDRVLAMMPQISSAIQTASSVIARVITFLVGLGKTVGTFLKPIAPFLTGIVSAFVAFAAIMGTAKLAVTAFNIVMQAMRLLMLTNPIGWVLLLIGLLIGAFIKMNGGIDGTKKMLAGWFNALKAWWKSDGTQAWVSRIVAVFKQFVAQIGQAFNWIMQQVRIYWPVVQNTIVQVFQYIRTNVLPVVMEIAKNVGGMFVRIWTVARPLLQQLLTTWIKSFKQIWAAVQPLAVTLGRVFKTVFPIVLQAVAAIYKAVTTYLPPVLAFVGEIFVSIYQAVVPIITDVVTSVVQTFNAVLNWALAIWPYVQQIIAGVFQYIQWVWAFIGPYVMAAIEILKSIIMNGFNFIAATIQFIWTTIKSIIMIAWSLISGIIKTALAIFTGDWQGAWDGVRGIVVGVWEGIKTFISGFGTWLFDSGKAIIMTLVDGIKSVASAPVEAVKNIFSKVRELLPFSDAKTGPLSELTYSGSKIPGTIAEGVAKGAGLLRAAAHNMMEGLGLDRTFAFRFTPEAPASVPMPEVQRQPVNTIAQAPVMIEAGIRSGIARLRAAASAIMPGFKPVLALPGGGTFPGGIPEYPPFPGPPAPEYDPTPPAPAPGAGRSQTVNLREVFRETSVERETIREKGGTKQPITVNIYGGSEKQRRDLLDVLERFNEQNRE